MAEQTPQERLADLLHGSRKTEYRTDAELLAAAILDSDVIREAKAEAWDRCADELAVMNAKSAIERANPYREVTGT